MAGTLLKRPLEEISNSNSSSPAPDQLRFKNNANTDEQLNSVALSSTPSLSTKSSKRQRLPVNKFKPYYGYKSNDFTPRANALTFIPNSKYPDFYSIDDCPYSNRRGFVYQMCSPNPLLPVMKFSACEMEPFKPTLSMFDRSPSILISKDLKQVTTERGWVSSRADIPMTEGSTYFEFNIINSDGQSHVRLGISRREAKVEAPVGFDGYSYGIRDMTGEMIHLSRLSPFMKDKGFKTGDVLGVLVYLPRANIHEEEQIRDIVRDQVVLRYKNRLFSERYDYLRTIQMQHLHHPLTVYGEEAVPDLEMFKPKEIEGSYIRIFKNGIDQGILFDNLYEFRDGCSEMIKNPNNRFADNGLLGYYPMCSVFGGGIVEFNPGPDFTFKPEQFQEDNVKEYWELYDEKIVEDMVWDMVDEIEAEFIQEGIEAIDN